MASLRFFRNRWRLTAVLAVVLLALWGLQKWRGPVLPGYQVQSGPLIQSVVATGRVAAPSRVQISPEITGLVQERRVREGDHVAAGDVLIVLRADDLKARRDQARAALAALQQAERPNALAQLRQTEAQLAQAERELQRRRDLSTRQLIARESVEHVKGRRIFPSVVVQISPPG